LPHDPGGQERGYSKKPKSPFLAQKKRNEKENRNPKIKEERAGLSPIKTPYTSRSGADDTLKNPRRL